MEERYLPMHFNAFMDVVERLKVDSLGIKPVDGLGPFADTYEGRAVAVAYLWDYVNKSKFTLVQPTRDLIVDLFEIKSCIIDGPRYNKAKEKAIELTDFPKTGTVDDLIYHAMRRATRVDFKRNEEAYEYVMKCNQLKLMYELMPKGELQWNGFTELAIGKFLKLDHFRYKPDTHSEFWDMEVYIRALTDGNINALSTLHYFNSDHSSLGVVGGNVVYTNSIILNGYLNFVNRNLVADDVLFNSAFHKMTKTVVKFANFLNANRCNGDIYNLSHAIERLIADGYGFFNLIVEDKANKIKTYTEYVDVVCEVIEQRMNNHTLTVEQLILNVIKPN